MLVPNDRPSLERLPIMEPGFPPVLSTADEAGETRIVLDVRADLCWFRGHFPGQPVLPGIVQLHWATLVSRSLFGFSGVPREIKRLKFRKVVVPPRELELAVTRQGEHNVRFRFTSSGDVNSEGQIVFADEP
jgi:3-hydroxymyristoyl/3-hydroxydecanoyl-(acyl carrier protein) dehydratase